MRPRLWNSMRDARTWATVLALTTTAGAAGMFALRTPEATAMEATAEAVEVAATTSEENAKGLLKASSDYMAAQRAFSFDYDTNLEVVTKENQKIGLASSGTITVNRPDKLRATRTGGFSNVEFAFDGKTVTMFGRNANAYAQVQASGTIDKLVDELRTKYHRPIPGADLLMSDVYGQLMPEVVDIKDLGSGVVAGVECDHLAFRTKDVDWQIWIAQGSRPYPCRYVITSTQMTGAPQYSINVRSWRTGAEVTAERFTLNVPPNAKKLNPGDIPDFDELPGIFSIKRANRGQ
jgi:hypothetical protein